MASYFLKGIVYLFIAQLFILHSNLPLKDKFLFKTLLELTDRTENPLFCSPLYPGKYTNFKPAPNKIVSKHIKLKLPELQGKLDIEDLNNNIELTDIYKILHPELEYILFYMCTERLHNSSSFRLQNNSQKTSKNGYYTNMFSSYNTIKIEGNNKNIK